MTAGQNTRAGFDIDLREFMAFEGDLLRILVARGVVHIEHKRDFLTIKTGNLFVEYKQPSGWSGIVTTTADMWAFEYDDNRWLLVPTDRLKRACKLAERQKRKARGGDHDRYHGLLVPIKWLVPPYVSGVADPARPPEPKQIPRTVVSDDDLFADVPVRHDVA